MFARLGNNVSLGRSLTGLQYHHRLDGLAPGIVRDAEYSGFENGGMLMDRGLNLCAVNVLAPRDNHVLGAIHDKNVTLGIPRSNVACPHPAISQGFFSEIGPTPIAQHIGLRTDNNFARRAAVSGYRVAIGVDHQNFGDESFTATGAEALRVVTGDRALMILLRQESHGHPFGLAVALNHGAGKCLERRLDH